MAPSPWIQTITGLGSAQGAAGCGGRQRRSLAVEAAYGMPRNSRYSSVTVPPDRARVRRHDLRRCTHLDPELGVYVAGEIIVATPDAVDNPRNARSRRTRAGLLTAWSLLEELLVDRG
jgi:hypothetical protein